LLNDDHKISNENKLMLEKEAKRKKGAYYPSGRPTPAMVEYARELGLQDSYMISYNGAITNLKENKIIFRTNTYSRANSQIIRL
jgi:hydroxymethylpyrimidine pyrophosphatase-like HAD family hydrolase